MITVKDLQEAIAECQGTRNPDSKTCMKLAAFYTILDHLQEETEPVETNPTESRAVSLPLCCFFMLHYGYFSHQISIFKIKIVF